MKKKRSRPSAERIAQSEAVWQRLRERLDYHRQKLAEEQGGR